MAIVINGSGTVTGLAVGGLPDGTVDTDTLANTTVTAAKVAADVATQAEIDAKLNLAGGTMTGQLNLNSHLDMGDNHYIAIGAGDDLQLWHDGTNSHIKNTAGTLFINSDGLTKLQDAGANETFAEFNDNSGVNLYFDNVKKFETTNTGATVTGKVESSGVYNNGDLVLESNSNIYLNRQTGGGATMLKAIVDGAVQLFHDNSQKFETTAGGIIVTNAAGTVFETKTTRTIEQYGTANNWMKMMFAGSNGNEYYISFRTANNTQVGTITTNGSSATYGTSSDYRLKENVDYTWDATTRLKQLKPARFNFIADDTNTLVDGFIAHEVSSIVPEAITGTKDGMTTQVLYVEGDELPEGKSVGDVKEASVPDMQGIDQSKLVPLLVKTIQELEARITALEA